MWLDLSRRLTLPTILVICELTKEVAVNHIIDTTLLQPRDPIHEGIVLANDAVSALGTAAAALDDFEQGSDPWTFPNAEVMEACHSELIALHRSNGGTR